MPEESSISILGIDGIACSSELMDNDAKPWFVLPDCRYFCTQYKNLLNVIWFSPLNCFWLFPLCCHCSTSSNIDWAFDPSCIFCFLTKLSHQGTTGNMDWSEGYVLRAKVDDNG